MGRSVCGGIGISSERIGPCVPFLTGAEADEFCIRSLATPVEIAIESFDIEPKRARSLASALDGHGRLWPTKYPIVSRAWTRLDE